MMSWMTLAGLLVVGVAPGSTTAPSVVRQRVDLIELNHFVDEEGREVFRQVIFYDWSKTHNRFHVRAWRLVKKPSQLPQRRWDPDHYQCTWNDEGLMRQVWSPSMRETWTQRDPERVNRGLLPEDQRVPLWVPKVAKRERSPRQAAVAAEARIAAVPGVAAVPDVAVVPDDAVAPVPVPVALPNLEPAGAAANPVVNRAEPASASDP